MKLLIFSDVHGNRYAWDEFLREIRDIEYDYLIFCGDIFGYYYDQQYIFDYLCRLQHLIWLKGNHDEYFLQAYEGRIKEEELIEKYGHSYDNVRQKYSEEVYVKLRQLPEKVELVLGGYKVGIFHGTPENTLMGRLYPKDLIVHTEFYEKYDIIILGHTHFSMKRFLPGTNKLIINPGSLGQPRDGKGSRYALLNIEAGQVENHTIYYDNKELYKKIDQYDEDLKKLKDVLERKVADD